MPDLMNYLRLANIFSPMVGNDLPEQGGITGNMPRPDIFGNVRFGNPMMADPTSMGTTQVASPDDYDAGARMRELYTPEHVASDRYNELIGGYPKYEDYKPSMLRRIASAIIATGQSFGPRGFAPNANAVNAGMEYMDRPYNTKFTDWKNQIGPAQNAANLERSENTNNRTLAYQTVSQEIAQRRADATARNQEQKNKIAQDRAEVYRLKSLKKNYKFDFSGPTVKITDPDTGEVKVTNIETGNLSDSDKMELQQDQALERIHATGGEQRKTEELRQTGREGLAETRGWKIGTIPDPNDPNKQIGVQYNEITGEVKPIQMGGKPTTVTPSTRAGSGNNKPESPTQTRVRQFNAARELYNTRADLRPFIKLGSPGSNDFTITPPGKGFFGGATGPNPQQYQELQDAIYGNSIQPVASHGNTPQRMVKTQRNTRTGATRQVESLDGGKTWRPVSNQ